MGAGENDDLLLGRFGLFGDGPEKTTRDD